MDQSSVVSSSALQSLTGPSETRRRARPRSCRRALQSLTGPSETRVRGSHRVRDRCFNPSQVRLKLSGGLQRSHGVRLQSLTGPSETRWSALGDPEAACFNPSQVRLKRLPTPRRRARPRRFNPSQVRLKPLAHVVPTSDAEASIPHRSV